MSVQQLAAEADVEERRRVNLRRLLNPRSIAAVGASVAPTKAGFQALKSLGTFPGTLVAVHPREKSIQGLRCYPNFASLPEPVDLAVLAKPARHCVQAAADAAARGVGGIFVISGGFGEAGDAGAALQARLAEICRGTGLRLLGPNTSGFINPHGACVASFVPGVDKLPKGRIAVVAQSGGVNRSISCPIKRLGEGTSLAVGLGNAVDVGAASVLAMLAEDASTEAIALHLEGVRRVRELVDVLRRVTPHKPVVALVAGRADIGEFAVSRTGNLMGSYQRTVAALVQAGVVVVDSTEALAQAAAVLANRRLPAKQRNGIGLVTGQAGPGLLIIDGLKCVGVDVPELAAETIGRVQALLPPPTFLKNAVDTGRPDPGFGQVVSHVTHDEKIDAILVFGPSEPSVLDPSLALRSAHRETGKPIVIDTLAMSADLAPALASLRHEGITAVLSPERMVLAGVALDADARAQWRLLKKRMPQIFEKTSSLVGPFNEDRAKALIASYGIARPEHRLCVGRAQAFDALRDLMKPVVVKIAADDIAHQTEAGGGFLSVGDDAALESALNAIERIPTSAPGHVLVEGMAPVGVELIVGAVRDPSGGPCVVVGLGGVVAGAAADSAVRLAPLDAYDVAHMLKGLRGKKLLDGFRHLPRCDRDAIAHVAVALGRMLIEHPEMSEVEINALRVDAQGALALDALVVLGPRTPNQET